jgi:hypothetical protein
VEAELCTALHQFLGAKGQAWAAKDRKDAQNLKEDLYGIQNMSAFNPHRAALLDLLWTDFAHHGEPHASRSHHRDPTDQPGKRRKSSCRS